jgi:hypothetical protein
MSDVASSVQPRVLDRDRGPSREHDRRLLVGFVELALTLAGEVKVAPGLVANQDRYAQAKLSAVVGIDAVGDEVRELLARVIENPDRRVLRGCQLARDVQKTFEHSLELALGDDRPPGFDQPAQPVLVQA